MQTLSILCCLSLGLMAQAHAGPALVPEKPIVLPGSAGSFDFMALDQKKHRILAAHRGSGTLEIVNLQSGQMLPAIEVGEAQGVAIDSKGHQYFLGDEGDHKVVFVDSDSLKKTGEVSVDGPVDAIEFEPTLKRIYAAEDAGNRLWVIDIKTKKVIGTITIPGKPEVIEYDPKTNRLYLNIKDKNLVVVIDPKKNKIEKTWSTDPLTGPHGLAIDSKNARLFVAGRNELVIAMDLKTGKILDSAKIPAGVDQIFFDSGNETLYSACKEFISITKWATTGFSTVDNIPSAKGAHTLSVDPQTHNVWISYADKEHSYFQKMSAANPAL